MTDDTKTMQAGDDPGDFTIPQVTAYLDGLPDGPDKDAEVQRVLDAERAGQARTGLVGSMPPDEPEDGGEGGVYDEAVTRETTDAFIIPNYNTIPQSVQDEDAAARNQELVDAGVNQDQGFIGSDGRANLLG
jgi:hypothetical protein